jgi:hypothetical protein
MEKMKYVKVEDYKSIIIFPTIINHSEFKYLKPISAGFCYISPTKVECFGESIGLGLKSQEEDTFEATKQYCGIEEAIKLLKSNKND